MLVINFTNFQLLKIKEENDSKYEEILEFLRKIMDIGTKLVERIIRFWWTSTEHPQLQKQLFELRKSTGECLRIDHTYKITSILGGYSNVHFKWVLKLIN